MLHLLCKAVVMRVSHLSHARAQCEELKELSYAQHDSAERVRGHLGRKGGPLLLSISSFAFLKNFILNLVTDKMSPIALTSSFYFVLPCPHC